MRSLEHYNESFSVLKSSLHTHMWTNARMHCIIQGIIHIKLCVEFCSTYTHESFFAAKLNILFVAGSVIGSKHTERKLKLLLHTQVIGYMLCKNARVYIALNKACPFLNEYTSTLTYINNYWGNTLSTFITLHFISLHY